MGSQGRGKECEWGWHWSIAAQKACGADFETGNGGNFWQAIVPSGLWIFVGRPVVVWCSAMWCPRRCSSLCQLAIAVVRQQLCGAHAGASDRFRPSETASRWRFFGLANVLRLNVVHGCKVLGTWTLSHVWFFLWPHVCLCFLSLGLCQSPPSVRAGPWVPSSCGDDFGLRPDSWACCFYRVSFAVLGPTSVRQ